MSVLYCTIPQFAAALVRRDHPDLADRPLVLVGTGDRVWAASAEAVACGIGPGMPVSTAEVRCPEAHWIEAEPARYRLESETLLQILEDACPRVEPHGWGAAYADLGDDRAQQPRQNAIPILQVVGRTVRREMGAALQPAMGWDSSKFTAQAAAWRTEPGHLRAIDGVRQQAFLRPLPVTMLPLGRDMVQRLGFLGLRTLGQYGGLPRAAVWQQFGRVGVTAHRCARGEDDRPVIPRWKAPQLADTVEFETPLAERARLVAALAELVRPLLADATGRLQACGRIRLTVRFEDGSVQERARAFLQPVSEPGRVVRALEGLLDKMRWAAAAVALSAALEEIQDAAPEQLTLFPLEKEGSAAIDAVQRYLATRFQNPASGGRLRRAALVQPGAPLAEWRIQWLDEGEP